MESLPEDKREEELASNLPKRKAKVEDPAIKSAQKRPKIEKKATKAVENEVAINIDNKQLIQFFNKLIIK